MDYIFNVINSKFINFFYMINQSKYYKKKIAILGIGKTGLSCINFFLKQNVIPLVMDNKLSFSYKQFPLLKQVKLYLGPFKEKLLSNLDMIVVSPGISLNNKFLINAVKKGIEVVNDIEIFCRENKNPIIAITGTNGKSTVVKMLEKIIQDANISVEIGGNIGVPVLNLLNNKSEKKLFILEISSFQLEHLYSLKSLASVVLNVTEDHMDRYPSGLNQYHNIKMNIYKNSQTCLVNLDYFISKNFKIFTNKQKIISFGENNHAQYNLSYINNFFWLRKKRKKILNTNKINLIGKHNYINSLVALAFSDLINIPHEISLKSISKFTGLPHRFQLIHKNNNISWINDSKSTNIGSTIQAINCIKTKGNIWLLLGGDGKSANFNYLIPFLQKKNLIIYCYGKDKQIMYDLNPNISIKKNNIKEAIKEIALQVKPGDIVLLSPSCASYDQFKNFEERGNNFTYLAKKFG